MTSAALVNRDRLYRKRTQPFCTEAELMAFLSTSQVPETTFLPTRQPATAQWRERMVLLLLAATVVGLNALKPLCVDDFCFWEFARHLALEPARPYAFESTFGNVAAPANNVLCPPIFTYWWSLGIRLFGLAPWAWKLWSFPLEVVGVYSFSFLAERWCGRAKGLGLTLLLFLSPAVLPSVNMMLDLPALCLTFASIALFIAACDRSSFMQAAGAGLLAALAIQTKYTACTAPLVMLLWGISSRRVRLSAWAFSVCAIAVIGWEVFVAHQVGASHFWVSFQDRDGSVVDRVVHLLVPDWTQFGLVSLPALLLMASGLSSRPYAWGMVAAWYGVGVGASAVLPTGEMTSLADGVEWLSVVWMTAGIVSSLLLGFLMVKVLLRQTAEGNEAMAGAGIDRFLVAWLLLEVGCSLAISPFPAARRVLGVGVVALLLVGRWSMPSGRPISRSLVIVTAFAGLFVYAIDWMEAWSAQECLARAHAFVQRHADFTDRKFHLATYGARYYAEQETDWEAFLRNRTVLQEGDWMVILQNHRMNETIEWGEATPTLVERIEVDDAIPWTTWGSYYEGSTPIKRKIHPRATAEIYRVAAHSMKSPAGPIPGEGPATAGDLSADDIEWIERLAASRTFRR